VLLADSGEQALTLAKNNKIDLILLDLLIPKLSGFEVIENLRTKGYDSDIKILVFSNMSQPEERKKALELGADGFLVKADYTPNNLVKEIKRLLNQFSEEKKNERNANGGSSANNLADPNRVAKKILMMEDEEVFRDMFGEKLKQDGFDVTFAENGAIGVKEALEGGVYDLFIIDMIMPAMTGDEIIAKLKLEDKTKEVPIIVLSASVDEEAQKEVKGMGIIDFFVKTQIIPSELSKKVEEILNKTD
jgi:DNA-binding response OmpR family regulator